MKNDCFLLNMSAGAELVDLSFPESFSYFFTGLFPWKHLESILRVLEDDWSIVFTFALTAFFTASFQESRSRPWVSNWAEIEGLRASRRHQIMISSFGVVVRSNSRKTTYKCFR